MHRLDGVLLDVDGTLVDSNDANAYAWVEALARHGIGAPFAKVRRLIGKGGDKLLPEVAGISADDTKGKAISRARKDIFMTEYLPSLRPFPGVIELLHRMKKAGLRLATASSAKKEEMDALINVCGADEFLDARTSSEEAENSKPDPDIIHAALEKMRLAAGEVILLGDTPYDIEAGTQASIAVVALRCGGWRDEDLAGAIAIYDDVKDLLTHFSESPFSRKTKTAPAR